MKVIFFSLGISLEVSLQDVFFLNSSIPPSKVKWHPLVCATSLCSNVAEQVARFCQCPFYRSLTFNVKIPCLKILSQNLEMHYLYYFDPFTGKQKRLLCIF